MSGERNERCLVILPFILFRHSLNEPDLSCLRMILTTSDSLMPKRSRMVSYAVLSSQAIWMTAEMSPSDSGASRSDDGVLGIRN